MRVSAIDFPGRAPAIDFHVDLPKRKEAALACKLQSSHSFFLPPCHPKWHFCDSSSARNGSSRDSSVLQSAKARNNQLPFQPMAKNDSVPLSCLNLVTSLKNCR